MNSYRYGVFTEKRFFNRHRPRWRGSFLGFFPAGSAKWWYNIWVGIPRGKALESVHTLLVQNVLITFIVIILAVVLTSSFAESRIINKIEKLVETSRKLASGDLNARTNINPDSGELGFLARTFDSTIEILKQRAKNSASDG
jgi:methyl-accepting chemotaxis protein